MAYATDHLPFTRFYAPAARAPRPSLLRRLANALMEWRQRKADREVAAYIARQGGRLTDSIEREMMAQITRSTFGEWRR